MKHLSIIVLTLFCVIAKPALANTTRVTTTECGGINPDLFEETLIDGMKTLASLIKFLPDNFNRAKAGELLNQGIFLYSRFKNGGYDECEMGKNIMNWLKDIIDLLRISGYAP